MAWKQVHDANWRIPYVGGWCQGYVGGAWGKSTLPTPQNQTTSGMYGSAIEAWNAEPNKHYDLPPKGITVPVYFSLGNVWQGHVAIMLDDGMVASSTLPGYHPQGYLHPNIQDLINMYGKYNGGCKYLGWGEEVAKMRVVEQVNPNATTAQIKQAYLDILERPADAGGIATYSKYPIDFVRADLTASAEREQLLVNKQIAADKAQAEADRVEAERVAAEAKAKQDAIDAETARLAKEASDKAIADAQEPTDEVPVPKTETSDWIIKFINWLVGLIRKLFKR